MKENYGIVHQLDIYSVHMMIVSKPSTTSFTQLLRSDPTKMQLHSENFSAETWWKILKMERSTRNSHWVDSLSSLMRPGNSESVLWDLQWSILVAWHQKIEF